MGEILFRNCSESGYFLMLDRTTGLFWRISNKGEEVFFNAKGPELLDISITNFCERGCDFCYRKSNLSGKHMDIKEYCRLLDEAKWAGVTQVALGGGNPNQHPDFVNILKETRQRQIIPSYTTNGMGMTKEIYEATQKYCGAIAVSWYKPKERVLDVINTCKNHNIKLNIHFLLNEETLPEAIHMLQEKPFYLKDINSIVFLNYKPVNGKQEICLHDNRQMELFLNEVVNFELCKIGFDSCMISYLSKIEGLLEKETVDFCEAARFSAFIDEESILYPCSFMRENGCKGVDLKNVTLKDAWQSSPIFMDFRNRLKTPGKQVFSIVKCNECEHYEFCHGGCQEFNINMCRGERE